MFFSKKEENPKDVKPPVQVEQRVKEPLPSVQEIFPPQEEPHSAPLFVKVDKYKEIITIIQEMKIFISGVKEVFNLMNEAENVKADALKIMRATLTRLERSVVEIDTQLLRPKGLAIGEMKHGEPEVYRIEGSLKELQQQLGDLRRELQQLK